MEALTTELVERLKGQGFGAFVCLGRSEGDSGEQYVLVPSKMDSGEPGEKKVDGESMVTFDSSEVQGMLAGDGSANYMVKMPESMNQP